MKRRTKILLRSIVIMVIIIGATLALLMSLDVFKQKYEFRSQTEDVLNLVSSKNSKSIYDGASDFFRKRQNKIRFKDVVDRLQQTLGRFESIVRVRRNDRIESAEGLLANVRYDFKFEKAETRGEFSYILDTEQNWRLLGFDVRIPEELEQEYERLTTDPKRLSAPLAVVEKTKEIIERLAKGQSDEVYDGASKVFRDGTTKEKFGITAKAHIRALGKLKGLGEITDTAQNESKNSAHVDATLVFSNKTTNLDIHFYREEDSEWRMSSYKVFLPQPKIPPKPIFKN